MGLSSLTKTFFIPAKRGIHVYRRMDPRVRGDDRSFEGIDGSFVKMTDTIRFLVCIVISLSLLPTVAARTNAFGVGA